MERYGHGCDGRGGGWPGLEQVVWVRITRVYFKEPGQPKEVEYHCYLTSLSPKLKIGAPEELLKIARGHWGIENLLHHVKDRTLLEDASRQKPGAQVYCWMRNLAVRLLGCMEGPSAPQKMQVIQAFPEKAVEMLHSSWIRKGMVNF